MDQSEYMPPNLFTWGQEKIRFLKRYVLFRILGNGQSPETQ